MYLTQWHRDLLLNMGVLPDNFSKYVRNNIEKDFNFDNEAQRINLMKELKYLEEQSSLKKKDLKEITSRINKEKEMNDKLSKYPENERGYLKQMIESLRSGETDIVHWYRKSRDSVGRLISIEEIKKLIT